MMHVELRHDTMYDAGKPFVAAFARRLFMLHRRKATPIIVSHFEEPLHALIKSRDTLTLCCITRPLQYPPDAVHPAISRDTVEE